MPVSRYYKGHGEEVMDDMTDRYGAEKGKRVFYATANKRKQRPEDEERVVKRLAAFLALNPRRKGKKSR